MRTHDEKPVALTKAEAEEALKGLDGWRVTEEGVAKDFQFDNYYRTVSFFNVLAWLANQMNHHPDVTVGFKECRVRFKTHSIDDISDKDLEAAIKIEDILRISNFDLLPASHQPL